MKGDTALKKRTRNRRPHGRTGAPSMTARSTRSGWRLQQGTDDHGRPRRCRRRSPAAAGTRVSMSSATRSAVSASDADGRWLLRPNPGRSGARQWKPLSLAMCSRQIRPLWPAPWMKTMAGEPGVPGLLHVHPTLRTCDRSHPFHRRGRGRGLGPELRRQLLPGDPGLHHADVEVRCLPLPAVTETGSEPRLGMGHEGGQGRVGRPDIAFLLPGDEQDRAR